MLVIIVTELLMWTLPGSKVIPGCNENCYSYNLPSKCRKIGHREKLYLIKLVWYNYHQMRFKLNGSSSEEVKRSVCVNERERMEKLSKKKWVRLRKRDQNERINNVWTPPPSGTRTDICCKCEAMYHRNFGQY